MTNLNQRWVPYDQVSGQNAGDGLTRKILAFGEELMCVENHFECGAAAPLHSHPHFQITYVISGVFSFEIEGEVRTVKAGDTMTLRSNEVHGCTCLETGAILDIYSPMRKDFL